MTEGGTCNTSAVATPITVYRPLAVAAPILTPDCDNTFVYSATALYGVAPYTFTWTIQKWVSSAWVTSYTFTDSPAGATSSGSLDINSLPAPYKGEGTYRALVTVTDSRLCTANNTSTSIDVANALAPTAVKTSANGSLETVMVTGSPGTTSLGTIGYQWILCVGGTCNDIPGATSSTYTYSGFETDATPTAITFTLGSDNYTGKLYTAGLKVKVSRTLNGQLCQATSTEVIVKKIIAVDP